MKSASKTRRTPPAGTVFDAPYYRSRVTRRALQLYDWLYESAMTKAAPDNGDQPAAPRQKSRSPRRRG